MLFSFIWRNIYVLEANYKKNEVVTTHVINFFSTNLEIVLIIHNYLKFLIGK